MCVSPSWVWSERSGGPMARVEKVPRPCGVCWRCRENRKADYIGRALCESDVSDWSCTLTLTYAPRDDLADKVLTPEHFQKFIRSLRRRGHKVRYLVAGEYGDLKGRAHFHCVLFGKGARISLPQSRRCWWPEVWPHGHMFCDWNVDHRSIAYVVKYLLKWEGTRDTWVSMSKKPALGAEWFALKAARDVESGVLPSGFEYLPPGGRRRVPYLMTGATRRDYLRAVVAGFSETRAIAPERLSEWVYRSVEKYEWKAALDDEAAYWRAAGTDRFVEELKERLDERRLSERQANGVILRSFPSEEETLGAHLSMLVSLHNGQKDARQGSEGAVRSEGNVARTDPVFLAACRFHVSGRASEEGRWPRSWPYSERASFFAAGRCSGSKRGSGSERCSRKVAIVRRDGEANGAVVGRFVQGTPALQAPP